MKIILNYYYYYYYYLHNTKMHNYHLYVCKSYKVSNDLQKYKIATCQLNNTTFVSSRLFKYCAAYPYLGYFHYRNGRLAPRLEITIYYRNHKEKYVQLTIRQNNNTYEISSRNKSLDQENEIFNACYEFCKLIK